MGTLFDQLAEDQKREDQKREAPSVIRPESGQKCLVPSCKNPSKTRGLCKGHYGYCCRYIVQPGLRTWEDLEKAGKVLPAAHQTRQSHIKEYFLALILLCFMVAGCAQMFTAKTEAYWEKAPDGTVKMHYKSDKEQSDFDADVDPTTGLIHVKVGKAGTPEGVIQAVAAQIQVITDMLKQIAPMVVEAAKLAASKGAVP